MKSLILGIAQILGWHSGSWKAAQSPVYGTDVYPEDEILRGTIKELQRLCEENEFRDLHCIEDVPLGYADNVFLCYDYQTINV